MLSDSVRLLATLWVAPGLLAIAGISGVHPVPSTWTGSVGGRSDAATAAGAATASADSAPPHRTRSFRMQATIADESTPPDSAAPTGTSLRR